MSKYVGFRLGKEHESHVNSEYYCGGCGWPVTDHDSFCPECGGAFRECDADNLEAENAKLRELVVEVFKCARRGADCETCKVINDGYACTYIMRELGIEVG